MKYERENSDAGVDVPHFKTLKLKMPRNRVEAEIANLKFWDSKNRQYIYADVILDNGIYKRFVEFDKNGIAVRLLGHIDEQIELSSLFGQVVYDYCPVKSFTSGPYIEWASNVERIRFAESNGIEIRFCGKQPPALLIDLMRSGRWANPPREVWQSALPTKEGLASLFDLDQLDRLATPYSDAAEDHDFRTYKSAAGSEARPLPWLDASRSLLVAADMIPGSDLAVAVDFRDSDPDDPKVVVGQWSQNGYEWTEVFSKFSEFGRALGL